MRNKITSQLFNRMARVRVHVSHALVAERSRVRGVHMGDVSPTLSGSPFYFQDVQGKVLLSIRQFVSPVSDLRSVIRDQLL